MESTDKTKEVLQDLIEINHDRIAGFDQAAEDLEETDLSLRPVFKKLADDSRSYVNQLSGLAREQGLEPEEGSSTSGSLHRAWLDIKTTFTGQDNESLLEECHRCEHAIKDAYREALSHPNEIMPELYNLLTYQQEGIREGHDRILSLLEQAREDRLNLNDKAADTGAEEMEQENTAELQPGYEKQNIPGMEPPKRFAESALNQSSREQTENWNLEEEPEPFKDTSINFRDENNAR
jgi:uncharacterized protein (TIGR02284 family)